MKNLLCLVLCAGLQHQLARAAEVEVVSPSGDIRGVIRTDDAGALTYEVFRDGHCVVEPSRMGVTVDGRDLGAAVVLGQVTRSTTDDRFPTLGTMAGAEVRTNTITVEVTDQMTHQTVRLEARAADDGFAWRLIGFDGGDHRVEGEASSWILPVGCRVWLAERNNDWKLKSYAGEWMPCEVGQLPTISKTGPVQGPPLVAKLADHAGYVLISEAALANYSGMRLRATGDRRLQADFTEGTEGFVVSGPVTTPWRVTVAVRDLNELVNSNFIAALNPPPDARLYADTSYIRPGRSVWRWWSNGTGNPGQEQAYIDHAVALGFEYTLVDDGWEKWPDGWARLKQLAEYGRARGVGLFIWKDSKDLASRVDDRAVLRAFLDATKVAGAVGVKVDFFNSESKESVDFQHAILKQAAERRLMVNFHGVQKPTGEARTYPNEITREGIRGLELNRMREGPVTPRHNAALPFTRLAVGHGDYTPLGFSRPGPTTWAHQVATVVQFTSPLQVLAEDPDLLLNNPATRPALDVLKAIPSVWDETRVLSPSRIGELSIMARRSGRSWFVSILNGRSEPVSLPKLDFSFLGAERYRATVLTGDRSDGFARRELADFGATTALPLEIGAGDGAVIWLQPAP